MKKNKLTIGAAALAIFVTQQAAQATLISESSGFGTLVGSDASTVAVKYDVVFDNSSLLYTYLYQFTETSGQYSANPITDFNINASYVNSVLASGTIISLDPLGSSGITGSSTTSGGTIKTPSLINYDFTPLAASQLVGFNSYFGPTSGSGSLLDGAAPSPWSDNSGGTPIPVPVPEASTVMAGALMLLPFGIGAIRSLRKERAV
jgi:hypothetical protein